MTRIQGLLKVVERKHFASLQLFEVPVKRCVISMKMEFQLYRVSWVLEKVS